MQGKTLDAISNIDLLAPNKSCLLRVGSRLLEGLLLAEIRPSYFRGVTDSFSPESNHRVCMIFTCSKNRFRPTAVLREGTLIGVIEYCPVEDQKPTESEQLVKRRSIKGRQTRVELVSSSDD